MIRLKKYLKPFAVSFALAVMLLFGQALCDLNLPNFMSKIVNIGIQQSGIQSPSPDALSINAMKLAVTFMNEDEKALVLDNYELADTADKTKKERRTLLFILMRRKSFM